jgi:hypothetical protein
MYLAATKMLEVCLLMVFPLVGTSVPKIISFAGIVSQDQTSVPTQPAVQQPENTKSASPAAQIPKTPASSGKPSQTTKPRRKHPATSHASANPPKVVVKNGGATDPTVTFSPGLTQQQASSQRQSASQLIAGTDINLKKISSRQLSASQQEMVKQIQQYMEEAKTAGAAGDLEREHNLALKANLLSEELVKP